LQLAANNDQNAVVALLLESSADIDFKNKVNLQFKKA
jgi:hypothetical protein